MLLCCCRWRKFQCFAHLMSVILQIEWSFIIELEENDFSTVPNLSCSQSEHERIYRTTRNLPWNNNENQSESFTSVSISILQNKKWEFVYFRMENCCTFVDFSHQIPTRSKIYLIQFCWLQYEKLFQLVAKSFTDSIEIEERRKCLNISSSSAEIFLIFHSFICCFVMENLKSLKK